MTDREDEPRGSRSRSRARGQGAARWLYGALLVAIGACVGIVIGSVSDTPRLLLERLREPVTTVDVDGAAAPPAAEPGAKPTTPALQAFSELQNAAKARLEPAAVATPAPAVSSAPPPAAKPAPAKPAAAAPKAAPPPAAAKPAPKSPDELMRGIEQRAAAGVAPASPSAPPVAGHSVVQVLSLAERAQADALAARLKSQGFQPYLVPMPDQSGRFRVRVRPNAGQSVADLEQKLKGLGMKTWITAE
jgi:cell division septation protein DedD